MLASGRTGQDRLEQPGWQILIGRILLPLGLFAVAMFGGGVNAAHAARPDGKVAADLRTALTSSGPKAKWAASTQRGTYVQVVISADSTDPALSDLRAAVLAAGGSVFYVYQSAPALLAILPAGAVDAIAARRDVAAIVPNRVALRTASFLEQITGAAGVRASNPTSYNGAGIGIAILDSGIDTCHAAFGGRMNGNSGKCKASGKIGASVDLTRLSASLAASAIDWTKPRDLSVGYAPGSAVYKAYQRAIDGSKTANPDVYGHGTHVASVAAGETIAGAPDAAGIAPWAKLYDVRVLDENGTGQMGDVLAGIDWAIANHKAYNIRVLNLSLATPTVGSFLSDPLCRAVRAASAMGIVVVVAAGNYGLTADGKEVLGVIGSPANEPSAITVGSVKHYDTLTRGDESVNRFSSRGPTRSGWLDAAGRRHHDNLLKPDLVAPGNKIVGALAVSGSPGNVLVGEHPGLEVGGYSAGSNARQMLLSGTSVAAPAVAGAVAVMLQANPGLTPGLVKAVLQYTAQPLPGASIVQQGTGLLNVDGAVRAVQSLRTDVAAAVAAGTLKPGDRLLAAGRSLPPGQSLSEDDATPWSGLITAGGGHVVGGPAAREVPGFDDPGRLGRDDWSPGCRR